MRSVDATRLRREFASIIAQVTKTRESTLVTSHGRPLVVLVPADSVKPDFSEKALKTFCKKHGFTSVALFGSILRDDFGPESDIDVLVDLPEGKVFDMSAAIEEFEGISGGRKVDLVTKRSLLASKNWIRRNEILDTAKVICAP